MPEPHVMPMVDQRIGVIDIGSNSIRLVIYERLERSPVPIHNERVLCGLGRGIVRTGRLDAEAVPEALANLARFAQLARRMGVMHLDVVATAAVRDASDGAAFARRAEEACDDIVHVLSGEEEARMGAYGVLSAVPDADGIMGDLGGGSLELVHLRNGELLEQATLPLGPLRLLDEISQDSSDSDNADAIIDAALDGLAWLTDGANRCFYAVGGAWRALARLHIGQTNYPLHIIDQYRAPRAAIAPMANVIARQTRQSLKRISDVPRKRLDTLPIAARVLGRVLNRVRVADVVFSAQGLREGRIYNMLTEAQRAEDPLVSGCRRIASRGVRFAPMGDTLYQWMTPLFPGEPDHLSRLRLAACHLADFTWREHPDYRAEHAGLRVLRAPVIGLDHRARAFLAICTSERFGGPPNGSLLDSMGGLLEQEELQRARQIGAALRFAYTFSGGSAELVAATELELQPGRMIMHCREAGDIPRAEPAVRRLQTLASRMDRTAVI